MERTEDKSILITDKEFQKVLMKWGELSKTQKTEIQKKHKLSDDDIVTLSQLLFSLDFKTFEQPQSVVDEAFKDTLWQLAERSNSSKHQFGSRNFHHYFSRIAAILIIPLLIYTIYIQFPGLNKFGAETASQLVTITSQTGTITKLVLPDGSKVTLNAGSTLLYPSQFDKKSRNVQLEGEGYFEVVKNKKVPMVISTGNMNLKVYGTSFNVNAYQKEDFVKVTLIEGSVSLSSPNVKINGKDEFFITPGQTATYLKNAKEISVQTDDTFLFTAWKDGVLIFRNSKFETILKQLALKFNVDIELKDKNLASIPMDATFRYENINEILRLLSLSTPFKFHYADSQKLKDGTFTKSKIFIEKE